MAAHPFGTKLGMRAIVMVTFGSRFGVSTGAIRDLCSLAKRDDDRKCPIGKHDGAVVDCSSR